METLRLKLQYVFAQAAACTLFLCLFANVAVAQDLKAAAGARDGQHDFDFEIGTWKTDLLRLQHPLSGSNDWVKCMGTSVVSKIWNGRANLVELVAECPSGRFEGLNLRLYNPESQQWTLNFASIKSGTLSQPTVGGFKDGRGEFYDQELFNGRAVFVRFVITRISEDVYRFEQAFSDDGGKTWETNWIATDTRVKELHGDFTRPTDLKNWIELFADAI